MPRQLQDDWVDVNSDAGDWVDVEHTSDPAYSEKSMAAHPPKAPTQRVSNLPAGLEGKEVMSSPVMPLASAFLSVPKFVGGLAGTVAGGAGADQLSDALHLSPNTKGYVHDAGSFIGGALGTGTGAQFEDAFSGARGAVGRAMREPGKVTLSPGGSVPDTITKGPLRPIPKAIANVGKIFGGPQIADAVIPAHPEPIGMTSRLGKLKTPYSEAISKTGSESSLDPSFTPDDLISRTRKITIPGDEPTPQDLKRAGDYTQAPLQRLKDLAKFGDKLAKNELNRRMKN